MECLWGVWRGVVGVCLKGSATESVVLGWQECDRECCSCVKGSATGSVVYGWQECDGECCACVKGSATGSVVFVSQAK